MNEKQVQCESALAFLLDSLIEPNVYNDSFSGYFKRIINEHNLNPAETKLVKNMGVTNDNISNSLLDRNPKFNFDSKHNDHFAFFKNKKR